MSAASASRTAEAWPSRLLKKTHLLRWPARALAAAYRKYAWTHLRWVPRSARSALHLDLFEQPADSEFLSSLLDPTILARA